MYAHAMHVCVPTVFARGHVQPGSNCAEYDALTRKPCHAVRTRDGCAQSPQTACERAARRARDMHAHVHMHTFGTHAHANARVQIAM
jgi:hypothetical protein